MSLQACTRESKGFANICGENNCFLNSVLQCLMRCQGFVASMTPDPPLRHTCPDTALDGGGAAATRGTTTTTMRRTGSMGMGMGMDVDPEGMGMGTGTGMGMGTGTGTGTSTGTGTWTGCMGVGGGGGDFGDEAVLNANRLRVALGHANSEFEEHQYADAAEVLDTLLTKLHECITPEPVVPCCPPVRFFGLSAHKQCSKCRASLVESETAFNIRVHSNPDQRTMGPAFIESYIRASLEEGATYCKTCGNSAAPQHVLIRSPQYLVVHVVHPPNSSSESFLTRLCDPLDLKSVYGLAESDIFILKGVACAYINHYVSIVSAGAGWYLHDDSLRKEVGDLHDVVHYMGRNTYKPVLLFYQKSSSQHITRTREPESAGHTQTSFAHRNRDYTSPLRTSLTQHLESPSLRQHHPFSQTPHFSSQQSYFPPPPEPQYLGLSPSVYHSEAKQPRDEPTQLRENSLGLWNTPLHYPSAEYNTITPPAQPVYQPLQYNGLWMPPQALTSPPVIHYNHQTHSEEPKPYTCEPTAPVTQATPSNNAISIGSYVKNLVESWKPVMWAFVTGLFSWQQQPQATPPQRQPEPLPLPPPPQPHLHITPITPPPAD
ncbi:hypothetical protein Pelo_18054 [Pelomyxa schiedti]|nr:hypothetical protein Pelo_18054 [Pelomyxa schiedti]